MCQTLEKKSVCFLFTHTLMTVFIRLASNTGLFVSLFQVNSQNEALLHVYICLKSGRSSAFSVLGSERSRINLQRHESHNEFEKNERAHSRETQGKKGDNEKLGSFLWSSAAMTQLCTLAAIHSGTGTILDMDGGFFKTRGFSLLITLSLTSPS